MTDTTAPQRAGLYRLIAIALSLAFFVSPYLFHSGIPEQPGRDAVVGSELVGDGMYLVTRNETLVGIQRGEASLMDTLTAPWWDATRTDQGLWRPVPLFFLGLAAQLSGEPYNPDNPGDAPLPYHLIVLAFHILATMLLFDLALEISGSDKVALLAGALFATLPVHGEAIFDVAGLAELCAAAFAFGAWKLWLQAGATKNTGALVGCLALVALAAMSKESAFALPLVFSLVDAGRAPGKGLDFKAALGRMPGLVAMVVVLGAVLAIRISLVGLPEYSIANHLDNPLLGAGTFERAMNAMRLMVTGILVMVGINPLRGEEGFHFGQLFGFSSDYSATQVQVLGAFSMWNLIGALVLIASIVVAFKEAKRCGTRSGLWLAMLASMLITSNLLFPIGTIFGERLYYFPSAMLVLLVAMTLVRFGKAGLVAGLALSLGFGFWTNARAHDWTSNQTYFNVALDDAPQSAKAHYNWGNYLVAINSSLLAKKHFEDAVETFPQFAAAKGALGLALAEDLQYEAALNELIGDLDIQLEDSAYTYKPEPKNMLMGPNQLLLMITELRVYNSSINRPQEHLDWLDGLLAKGYQSPVAHALRGRTLLKLNRIAEAEEAYKTSLSIDPMFGTVRYYGELLRKLGRVDDALNMYDTYAKVDGVFSPTERAEFLLQRADAELAKDPLVAMKTLEEVKALTNALTPEQAFRYHWTGAQAMLANMPSDPGGQMQQLSEIEYKLKGALNLYAEANELTYSARYALVNIFAQTGNMTDLIMTAEDMLKYRSAPLLRTHLANALDTIGESDKAQVEWRQALDELGEQANDPSTIYSTRRGLLISLSREGDLQTAESELAAWRAAAPNDPLPLALGIDWASAWDRLDQAQAWAAESRATFPGASDFDKLFDQLPKWANLEAFIDAYSLAQQRFNWGHFEGAIAAAEKALSLAANDNEKALASGPMASALNALGRNSEAVERLKQALTLNLDPALKGQIEGVLNRMSNP